MGATASLDGSGQSKRFELWPGAGNNPTSETNTETKHKVCIKIRVRGGLTRTRLLFTAFTGATSEADKRSGCLQEQDRESKGTKYTAILKCDRAQTAVSSSRRRLGSAVSEMEDNRVRGPRSGLAGRGRALGPPRRGPFNCRPPNFSLPAHNRPLNHLRHPPLPLHCGATLAAPKSKILPPPRPR